MEACKTDPNCFAYASEPSAAVAVVVERGWLVGDRAVFDDYVAYVGLTVRLPVENKTNIHNVIMVSYIQYLTIATKSREHAVEVLNND